MQRFFVLHVAVHNVSTEVYKAKISKRKLWARKRLNLLRRKSDGYELLLTHQGISWSQE